MKRIFLWTLGALALPVATLLAINLRDEALDPEAATVLERSEAMAPVPRNAYVYATAFFAPPNESPYALGEKLLASYEAISRAADVEAALKTINPPGRLAVELTKLPCNVADDDCIAQARATPKMLRVALDDAAIVSQRCAALHELPIWRETYVPDRIASPLAITGAVHVCQRLRFARAALELRSGHGREALARVLSGIAFEREALAGSVTLIGKMMSLAALGRSMLFLSDLLRSEPRLAASNREAMANAVRPLTGEERTLGPVLRNEFRHFARVVREFDAGKLDLSDEPVLRWLARTPLHRVNATLNRAWLGYRDLIEAQELPAHAFDAAQKKWRESLTQRAVPAVHWVYNPVGKLALAIAVPQLSEYVGRMHDVDALVRLVAAQTRIASGFNEAAIRSVLGDSVLSNPYTGGPMEFDSEARTLSFATERRPTWKGKRWGGDGRVTVRLAGSKPL